MRWLLQLYPKSWRERYEKEMLALLAEHKVTPATVLDLLVGALDANLNYDGFSEGVINMVNRLRSGIVMVFCAFMLFGVGWSLLQRITDPMPNFQAVNEAHPELGVLFMTDFIVGCLSFVAFLVGGLPVFFISTVRAMKSKQRNVLIPFAISVSCLVAFLVATATLASWHHIAFALAHIYVFIGGYFVLFAILLVIGTVSVSFMVSRTNFQLSELKFVYIPEIAILLCMIISFVSSTILLVSVTTRAPQLLSTQDVSSPIFLTGIIFIAFGTIFASIGLKRSTIRGVTN